MAKAKRRALVTDPIISRLFLFLSCFLPLPPLYSLICCDAGGEDDCTRYLPKESYRSLKGVWPQRRYNAVHHTFRSNVSSAER